MFAKPNGADRSEISHEEVVETQLSNLTVIPLCGNLKGTNDPGNPKFTVHSIHCNASNKPSRCNENF